MALLVFMGDLISKLHVNCLYYSAFITNVQILNIKIDIDFYTGISKPDAVPKRGITLNAR